MRLLSIVAEIGYPITEFFLRFLSFDFLRDDVLDVNSLRPNDAKFIVIPVTPKLDLFKAVARTIDVVSEIRVQKIVFKSVVGWTGGSVALFRSCDGVLGIGRA